MAQILIKEGDHEVFVSDFVDAERFRTNTAPYRSRNSEWARRATEMLRARGFEARAVTDTGHPLDPQPTSGAAVEPPDTEEVVTWRGITPKKVNGRWFITWTDPLVNQEYSIGGNTARGAINNLRGLDHPAALRFLASLPPEEIPVQAQPQPKPVAPAQQKIMRPGDLRSVSMEAPERRVTQPAIPPEYAEYQQWEASASVAQLKDRFKHDPAFRDFYLQQQGVPKSSEVKGI